MRFDSNPSSLYKQNHVFCVKFAVSFLLMGLVFRLFFFSDSITLSSVIETTTPPLADQKTVSLPAEQQTEPIQTLSASDFPANETQTSQNGRTQFSFHFYFFPYVHVLYSSTKLRSLQCKYTFVRIQSMGVRKVTYIQTEF